MAMLSLILTSIFTTAFVDGSSTVRAEAVQLVPGIGHRNQPYQIEIGHKGVLQGNLLADMAAAPDPADEVVTLSGHPRSVHDGLRVLRISQENPENHTNGCAVVGLGLVLASIISIVMKLSEYDDPYADLRGSPKTLTWVRMTVHSSMEVLEDQGLYAKIAKQAQDLVACIGYMAKRTLRKTNAKIRRMTRPNIDRCDYGDQHQDFVKGVEFVPTAPSEPVDLLGDSFPMMMPEEPKPSELANLTMEVLAEQLENAGQDDLAAQMLSSSSKSIAMSQMRQVHEDVGSESESECVI